jgi:DNA-binding IclR family transcriptional regulator
MGNVVPNKEQIMVKSVDRITRILRIIEESGEGLTNADLAKALDLPKSTLSKLLASLTAHEWLVSDKGSKRYTLGPLLFFLGSRYIDHLEIVHTGQRFLNQLQAATSENASMEVPSGREVVAVARAESPDAKIRNEKLAGEIQRLSKLGQRAPLYATAAGKCILAHWADSDIEEYLRATEIVPFTRHTLSNADRLWREIRQIRGGALAYNRRELNSDTIAVAAPVLDLYNRPVAALAVITPHFRFDQKKQKVVEEALRKAAAEFSRLLGHAG